MGKWSDDPTTFLGRTKSVDNAKKRIAHLYRDDHAIVSCRKMSKSWVSEVNWNHDLSATAGHFITVCNAWSHRVIGAYYVLDGTKVYEVSLKANSQGKLHHSKW